MHEEIKARKTIAEVVKTFEEFGKLQGKMLLFNKNSKYYILSGWLTKAYLNCADEDKDITEFEIRGPNSKFNFSISREELIDMLQNCDAVCGNSPEESFLFLKERRIKPDACWLCNGNKEFYCEAHEKFEECHECNGTGIRNYTEYWCGNCQDWKEVCVGDDDDVKKCLMCDEIVEGESKNV